MCLIFAASFAAPATKSFCSARLRRYALEGINDANGVVFVSNHSRKEFTDFFSDIPGLEEKCRIIPAGVNTEIFQPLQKTSGKSKRIARLVNLFNNYPVEKTERGLNAEQREDFRKKIKAAADTDDIKKLMHDFNKDLESGNLMRMSRKDLLPLTGRKKRSCF